MKIPAKLFKLWTKKHSRGDLAKLVNFTKASKPTIIKAIRRGYASEQIILKISQYYSEKRTITQKEIELEAFKLFANETPQNY